MSESTVARIQDAVPLPDVPRAQMAERARVRGLHLGCEIRATVAGIPDCLSLDDLYAFAVDTFHIAHLALASTDYCERCGEPHKSRGPLCLDCVTAVRS